MECYFFLKQESLVWSAQLLARAYYDVESELDRSRSSKNSIHRDCEGDTDKKPLKLSFTVCLLGSFV